MNWFSLVYIMESFFLLQPWQIVLVGKVVWVGICVLLELGVHYSSIFWLLKFPLRNSSQSDPFSFMYALQFFYFSLQYPHSLLCIQCFSYRMYGEFLSSLIWCSVCLLYHMGVSFLNFRKFPNLIWLKFQSVLLSCDSSFSMLAININSQTFSCILERIHLSFVYFFFKSIIFFHWVPNYSTLSSSPDVLSSS